MHKQETTLATFDLPCLVREMIPQDQGWIINSWSTSQLVDMTRRIKKDEEQCVGRKSFRLSETHQETISPCYRNHGLAAQRT